MTTYQTYTGIAMTLINKITTNNEPTQDDIQVLQQMLALLDPAPVDEPVDEPNR